MVDRRARGAGSGCVRSCPASGLKASLNATGVTRSLLLILALGLSLDGTPASAEEPIDFYKTHNIIADNHQWQKVPEPFFKDGDPQPYPPLGNYRASFARNRSTVVVLIAALRETRVVDSLLSMFQNAMHAERVYAGVVQQNAADDPDALEEMCRRLGTPLELRPQFEGRAALHRRQDDDDVWGQSRFTDDSLDSCQPARRVRVHRMDSSEAMGPAYARSRQPLLISDGDALEDFCMQIDAHTLFTPGWDDRMIYNYALTDNEYAVISTYPTSAHLVQPDGELPSVNDHWEMPYLCQADIQAPGVVRNRQAGAAAHLDRPLMGKFWAAGLSFSRCHAERDVPNDPGLEHVFDGEEFGRAVRLYTNGYDLYTLMRPVIGTFYGGEIKSKGGWVRSSTRAQAAQKRLATLGRWKSGNLSAEALEELKGYDIGKRRRLQDYIDLTGMDTINNLGQNTPCLVKGWTPWQPDGDPPYADMLEGSPVRQGVDIAAKLGLARGGRSPPEGSVGSGGGRDPSLRGGPGLTPDAAATAAFRSSEGPDRVGALLGAAPSAAPIGADTDELTMAFGLALMLIAGMITGVALGGRACRRDDAKIS